jgi:hypothetical protein
MSAKQRQKQQQQSIETKFETEPSEPRNSGDSTGDRISSRRARAGALLAQVYKRSPKVGISPEKVLFEWTKELVSFRISISPSVLVRFFKLRILILSFVFVFIIR